MVGDLGIRRIEGSCMFFANAETGERRWLFREEPRVIALDPRGVSRSSLEVGDVITAIDGALITTRAAGVRFARLDPGVAVRLTVRRDGRELRVRVVPGAICASQALGTAAAAPPPPLAPQMTSRFARRAAPPAAPPAAGRAPEPYARGWFGIGLSCNECRSEQDEDGPPVWSFPTAPEISYVDPAGPSARAGLERGDVITHIDGASITSAEGEGRFGAVRPGQRVRLTVRRGAASRTITVETVEAPGERRVSLGELRERLRALRDTMAIALPELEMERFLRGIERAQRAEQTRALRAGELTSRPLRYAGTLGGSAIEVRGPGTVRVDDSDEEIVITTRDAVIRIRQVGASRAPEPK